jgi:hypothetical protein
VLGSATSIRDQWKQYTRWNHLNFEVLESLKIKCRVCKNLGLIEKTCRQVNKFLRQVFSKQNV